MRNIDYTKKMRKDLEMINSLNSTLYTGIISARSIINNIRNNHTAKKAVHNNNSISEFKSLFVQIQAMAELDNSSPFGKKLNITI